MKFRDGTVVPALGQGSARLAQGRHPGAAEEEALRTGISLGMTLIDTSDDYSGGRSEELISHVIAGQRDRVFLVSKLSPSDVTGNRMARACAASLSRLGTDHLDLYLLHWPSPNTDFTKMVVGFENRDDPMAKPKRRPGGGRKPIGQFPKSAAFTTRLEPATRRALDEAAQAIGASVSEVAGRLLKVALKKPTGAPRNQALAAMVAELAEIAERDTGKSWQDDPWTGEALRYLVDTALFHFAPTPEDVPAVPPAIEQAGAKMPPELREWFRKPKGYGLTRARPAIAEIEQAATPAVNEWSLPIFFSDRPSRLGIIGRDLGLTRRKKGKSK